MVLRRLLAGAIDLGVVIGWAVVVIGAYLIAAFYSWVPQLYLIGAQVGLGFAMTIPVLICFALLESGYSSGTIGKRLLNLRVLPLASHSRIAFSRALARNLFKWVLPLFFIQQGVLAFRYAVGLDVLVVGVVAIVLPVIYVLGMFFAGRTLYDYVCGTKVDNKASRAVSESFTELETMTLRRINPDFASPDGARPRRAF